MNIGLRIVALVTIGAQLALSGTAVAQQCATRPDIRVCGTSNATGASLYSGVGPFNEVTGCAPDGNTQALFVTRTGTVAGNGAAWLAYLNAGGRIITEYDSSNDVYNELYGTVYANGAQFGDCSDNAMPSQKLNLSDPFWVANPIPPTASNAEGCGTSDLQGLAAGEPLVTPLGGLVDFPGSVTFARRLQAAGTLWLVDQDWSDGGQDANSATFMGALVTACGGAVPAAASVPVPVGHPLALLALAALIAGFGTALARFRRARPQPR
ncbi:MAG: hypothetical protein ABI585_07610 [Betaproteobacteria bacterium]